MVDAQLQLVERQRRLLSEGLLVVFVAPVAASGIVISAVFVIVIAVAMYQEKA